MTTDQILDRVESLTRIKDQGHVAGRPLTQAGLDWINSELVALDAELDNRKPEGEFVTLLGDDGQPVGFERVFSY